jgi:methionyl-tRNA formyltransferase
LLWRLAKDLATQPEPLQVLPIRWSTQKSTRRMYASMCDIPADISKDELDRRMRAFHDDFRGMTPTVTLHGIKFQAVAGAPTTAASTEPSRKPIEQMPGQRKRAYG